MITQILAYAEDIPYHVDTKAMQFGCWPDP
jgi:hypothetical protein